MRGIRNLIMMGLVLILLLGCSDGIGKSSDVTRMRTEEFFDRSHELTAKEFDEETEAIKEKIHSLSFDKVSKKIEESFETWLHHKKPDFSPEDYQLEIYEDAYLLLERSGKRVFNNINVNLHIDLSEFHEKEEEIYEEIRVALISSVIGYFKIHQIEMNGELYSHFNSRYRLKKMLIDYDFDERQEELELREIAFDFAQDFNDSVFGKENYDPYANVTLRHFGLDEKRKELYIEISIYEDGGLEHLEAWVKDLESSGKTLLDKLADSQAFPYLKAQGMKRMRVDFYLPWNSPTTNVSYLYPLE